MKKKLTWIIVLFFLGLALTSCQSILRKESNRLEVITEGQSILYAPQYVALAKGFFKEQDLEVEVKEVKESRETLGLLSASEPRIVLTSPVPLLTAKETVTPTVVFAQTVKDTGYYLLARELNSAFNWLDLKGNSIISGPEDWLPQMVLDYLLRKNNLRPQWDLTLYQNIPLTMTPEAFKNGTGAFLLVSEPTASQLENQGLGRLATPLSMGRWELPMGTYLTPEELQKTNPALLQKFTNGIYLAQLWMARHSSNEIAKTIHPHLPQMEKEALEKIIARFKQQGLWTLEPTPRKASFDLLQEILVASRQLKEIKPFDALTETGYASQAVRTVKLEDEKKK
ncbi:MAG: ABC transporter substrate-binding protein [Thermincolia bacterium]